MILHEIGIICTTAVCTTTVLVNIRALRTNVSHSFQPAEPAAWIGMLHCSSYRHYCAGRHTQIPTHAETRTSAQ